MPPHIHRPAPPQPPPPPKPHSAPGRPLVVGGYEIKGELGRGGMGVVYLARHAKLNRNVALKMLSGHYGPDELQRFLAEAETAAGLHHTNIAHIYEVGEHDGAPFYAMEHVESGSLADLLRKDLPAPRDAAQLLIRVARALHYAHQNGIVHRDMKPGNVLLDPEGVPKVADFGIAKRLKDHTKLTLSGAVVGTPTYMAPEQAKGTSRHVGPAADVYSLGAILYEMLTGRPPFLPEESDTAMTVRVLTEDPVSPAFHRPDIPRELEIICMKCLEKEPRARYASAADFADDLRRFLDDESILARPPTRFTRAVKWSRRHPWRTTATAALLVVAALGLERLWQWEFYERPHVEWAATVDGVDGGFEPIGAVSEAQRKQLFVSWKFTRRGRWGPVVRLEALNPRGNPAMPRRVTGNDVMPNWVEGVMGAQNVTERRRPVVQLDLVYSGRELVETIGLDGNKRVTWRLVWDRAAGAEGNRKVARARFVDLRGFDAAAAQGASHVEFQRDDHGRDLEVHFFNGSGQPAANGEGVFGYRITRDSAGRGVQLVNLGRDRRPAQNRIGIVALASTWNKAGLLERSSYVDGDGKSTPWNGIAAATFEYDAAGNTTLIRRLDEGGQPTNGGANGWSQLEYKRNERGEIVEILYQRTVSDGTLVPTSRTVIDYDQFGYPSLIKSLSGEAWQRQFANDASGNTLEERIVDLDGKPIAGPHGWSVVRYQNTPMVDPPGSREEEWFFGPNGAKAYSEGGYHHGIREHDVRGNLRRLIQEDHNPAQSSVFRTISEPEFDPQGRLRKLDLRMEDEQGQPIKGAGVYSGVESEYDENGRKVLEWQTGCDVETMGAPIWRTETQWNANGSLREMVRQACDESRQPLRLLPTGEPATITESYSGIGRLEKATETGFDEQRVGFYERDSRYVEGQFQSVTHRSADGAVVAPIFAYVKGYYPHAQPAAAELQVGDRLVTANGLEIGSTLEWTKGFKFPGGFIEVLRNDERIRVDGFEEGAIGIALEDRK